MAQCTECFKNLSADIADEESTSAIRHADRWVPAFAGMTEEAELRGDGQPAVYMVASRRNGTLYIGVTSDLCNRVRDHKLGRIPGFTKKYGVKLLVWFELCDAMENAIRKEKQMKEWRRAWKIQLIEKSNPRWADLYNETCGQFVE